jgi:hypothetical protein
MPLHLVVPPIPTPESIHAAMEEMATERRIVESHSDVRISDEGRVLICCPQCPRVLIGTATETAFQRLTNHIAQRHQPSSEPAA